MLHIGKDLVFIWNISVMHCQERQHNRQFCDGECLCIASSICSLWWWRKPTQASLQRLNALSLQSWQVVLMTKKITMIKAAPTRARASVQRRGLILFTTGDIVKRTKERSALLILWDDVFSWISRNVLRISTWLHFLMPYDQLKCTWALM